MLNRELLKAAEQFVSEMKRAKCFSVFVDSQTVFRSDPGLHQIRKRFNDRAAALQAKQVAGTLSQEEIEELRGLQTSLNTHGATTRFIRARGELVSALEECNRGLSEELGFNFASFAAPPACCK